MGFGLLDVYHSQGKSMDGMEVKNRHKLGGLKLDKIRLLSLVSHRKRLRVFGLQRQNYFIKDLGKNRQLHGVILGLPLMRLKDKRP